MFYNDQKYETNNYGTTPIKGQIKEDIFAFDIEGKKGLEFKI